MKIIGLTGSIATGKSFVAEIFKQYNIDIFSSDTVVASLLQEKKVIDCLKDNNDLSKAIKEDLIDKALLSCIVFNNESLLKQLEDILHPLVSEKREVFFQINKQKKAVLYEIPLLFEKKYQDLCDKVITTYCNEKTQIERALRRKNIDENRLNFIRKRQMPGNIKASLTDYLVYTDISYQYTRKQIDEILYKEEIIDEKTNFS